MKKIAYIVFCLLLLLSSCKPLKERDGSTPPIDPQTMEEILYLVHLNEMFAADNYYNKSRANHYYAWIFNKYNTNLDEFQAANRWYNKHYDKHVAIYKNLISRYQKELKRISTGVYQYYLPPVPSIWTYWGKYPEDTPLEHVKDLLPYYQLPATELRTNDSCSYPYVERLRSTTPYWKIRDE